MIFVLVLAREVVFDSLWLFDLDSMTDLSPWTSVLSSKETNVQQRT